MAKDSFQQARSCLPSVALFSFTPKLASSLMLRIFQAEEQVEELVGYTLYEQGRCLERSVARWSSCEMKP